MEVGVGARDGRPEAHLADFARIAIAAQGDVAIGEVDLAVGWKRGRANYRAGLVDENRLHRAGRRAAKGHKRILPGGSDADLHHVRRRVESNDVFHFLVFVFDHAGIDIRQTVFIVLDLKLIHAAPSVERRGIGLEVRQ